jgi:hypothetical protein
VASNLRLKKAFSIYKGRWPLVKTLFSVRIILKRKILFAMMVLGFAAMVQAQVWGPGWNRRNMPTNETLMVSGTMVVVQGMPALKSGDVTYFVSGISQLIGFIDGLKEGAQVTIEGVAMTSPSDKNVKFLRPSKLTINGKIYELSPPAPPEFPSNPGDPRLYQYRFPGPMGHMGPMGPGHMMPYSPAPRRR